MFLPLAVIFFWAGFVCAISFMEAWLKFRVKEVTLSIGLSIGKKVFIAMNRMEWIFLFIYFISLIYHLKIRPEIVVFTSLIVFLILAIQTIVLLPRLHKRVDLIVAGKSVGPSVIHVYYIVLEVLKVISLLLAGYFLFQSLM